MLTERLSGPLSRLAATNSTSTSLSRVPVAEKTIGDFVVASGLGGGLTPERLQIVPFGLGADGTTFDIAVYGWTHTAGILRPAQKLVWVPCLIAVVTACTLESALPGVNDSDVQDEQFFCADLTVAADEYPRVEVVASAGNGASYFSVDTQGFKLIEVVFDMGTATSGNGLYRHI